MQLEIRRLGHLGDGIADGPVFVPRTLPGEVVSGEVSGQRMLSPSIVTPSPNRVSPPCRHYRACGGCSLQHASDKFVTQWKVDVVQAALAAHGLEVKIRNISTSPPRSRRRATFSGRRLKSGPIIGFHAPGSGAVSAVPDCRLLRPELIGAAEACKDFVEQLGTRKGEMRFALSHTEAGVDVNVEGGRVATGADIAKLASLASGHGLARLSLAGETIATFKTPSQRFQGIEVAPPPGAFLQATAEGETALTEAVLSVFEGAGSVADLFSGCGTFALPLAKTNEVHAVEAEASLLAALDAGWRGAKGLKRVSSEARDLFRRPLLPDELSCFDGVVIDPPRAGAEAQMREFASGRVAQVVSISCNPVTFARDAAILVGAGYQIEWLDMVDQFLWSPHIELVALFQK